MPNQILTVTIDPKAGTISTETEGFQGKGCQSIHDAFDAMGKVTKEEIKPEFYGKGNRAGNVVRTGR